MEVANAFNREKHTQNGKTLSVSIRSIASGVAVDYMSSGKESPDLYTPSNHLWGELALEDGIDIHVEKEVLVENTAGILVNNAKYKELKNDSTNVDFDTIYQAVLNDQLSVGYPNPYSSSTGMNFLIHALYSCDSDNVLSDQAIEQFQAFQNKVALTSFTTQQLVKSAENGTVDCLVMEYQQYINDGTLQTKYKFVPFGYKHNNPVYSIGKMEEEKQEGIGLFLKECDKNEALASRNGFNKNLDYQENMPAIDGNTIKAAQSIWKETKDSGTSVLIEFVFDISGSMESNNRYENLKTAFLNSMDYINSENYVGVISYDGKVYKDVAMDKMNITQKGKIKGALTEISPAGKTAMYDAIVVAMDELHKKEAELSDQSVKKVVVVLTDGVSNAGRNDYDSCESLISNAGIPVYTISYDYDTYDLQRIADINEAEYINGTSEDIILKLKNLFQAIA
ncbi:MAG: VWA domain-containing protein [Firmicutes bacterium]|nr:VWA domain-containing protein [Bacillota bacterium]